MQRDYWKSVDLFLWNHGGALQLAFLWLFLLCKAIPMFLGTTDKRWDVANPIEEGLGLDVMFEQSPWRQGWVGRVCDLLRHKLDWISYGASPLLIPQSGARIDMCGQTIKSASRILLMFPRSSPGGAQRQRRIARTGWGQWRSEWAFRIEEDWFMLNNWLMIVDRGMHRPIHACWQGHATIHETNKDLWNNFIYNLCARAFYFVLPHCGAAVPQEVSSVNLLIRETPVNSRHGSAHSNSGVAPMLASSCSDYFPENL